MNRTQIYLTEDQEKALSARGKKTGRSKSDLIREAIDEKYLDATGEPSEVLDVLERTSGAWKGRRTSGADYVEKVRSGRLGRIHRS